MSLVPVLFPEDHNKKAKRFGIMPKVSLIGIFSPGPMLVFFGGPGQSPMIKPGVTLRTVDLIFISYSPSGLSLL